MNNKKNKNTPFKERDLYYKGLEKSLDELNNINSEDFEMLYTQDYVTMKLDPNLINTHFEAWFPSRVFGYSLFYTKRIKKAIKDKNGK